MASELRIITGCAAVHPDQRGGQHVAMACPGVLVIDDDRGLGVLMFDERSQIKNRARAAALLQQLSLTADEREALVEIRDELREDSRITADFSVHAFKIALLDKLLARGGER